MRFVIRPVNLALKEPCKECGNVMKCVDGCNKNRKNYKKQMHVPKVDAYDNWNGFDSNSNWSDEEMKFEPLETFAELFRFHLNLCNNDRKKASRFAKAQLHQQKVEKEQQYLTAQEINDGWNTVKTSKRSRC